MCVFVLSNYWYCLPTEHIKITKLQEDLDHFTSLNRRRNKESFSMATGGSPEQPGNQNHPEDSMHQCAICREDFPKQKNPSRFGILPNCLHIFCLPCEKKLRTTEGMTKQQKRRCPMCRTESDFVVPSNYYPDKNSKKPEDIVQEYKTNCGKIRCRYEEQKIGSCSWGSNCLYKHDHIVVQCRYEEQRIGSCSRRSNCRYKHDHIVGMNLLGQVGPVQSLRMNNINIRENQNTVLTLSSEVLDGGDILDLDP